MTPPFFLSVFCRILFSCILVFTPFAFGAVQPWARAVLHLGSLLMLASWLLSRGIEGKLTLRITPLHLFWVLALSYGTIRMLTSDYREASLGEITLLLDLSILFVIAVEHLKDRKSLHRALLLLGFLGVVLSLYRYLAPDEGTRFIHVNKNHFAGYIGMIAFLCLGHFSATWPLHSRPSLWRGYVLSLRAVTALCAAFLAISLVLSLSAGGTLSFMVTIVAFCFLLVFFRREVPWKRIGIAAVAALIGISILATMSSEHLMERHGELVRNRIGSAKVRLSIWKSTLDLILDNPLTGVGPGMYADCIARYRRPDIDAGVKLFYAHNEYLHVLAESGVIGGAIFLFGILGFCVWSFRKYRARRNPLFRNLALGPLTACLFLGVHNLVDFNLHIPANAVLFTFCMAMTYLSLAMHDSGEGNAIDLPVSNWSGGRFATWVVVAGFLFFIFVDGRSTFSDLRSCRARSKAEEAMSAGDYSAAIREYRRAIAFKHTDADHYYALGNAFLNLRSGQKYEVSKGEALRSAEWSYRKVLELNPYHYNALADLGKVFVMMGNLDEAEESLTMAVALNPCHHGLHEQLAWFYLNHRADGLERGFEEYRKTIELFPFRPEIFFQRLHQYSRAYEDLKMAVPDHPFFHYRFAKYLEGHGMWPDAVKEMRAAVVQSPHNRDYHTALAKLLARLGDHEGAAEVWAELRRLDPANTEVMIHEGEQVLKTGRLEDAREIFFLSTRTNPGLIEGYGFLADTYLMEGDPEGAKNVWEKAIQKIPWNGSFHFELARLKRGEGDWLGAVHDAKRAIDHDMDRNSFKEFLETLYLEKGLRYEAISLWKDHLDSNPKDIAARRRLARLFENQGRPMEAAAEYREILRESPDDKEAARRISALETE